MNFTFEQVISILGLLATIIGQALLLTRYIMGKHDDLAKALREELAKQGAAFRAELERQITARETAIASERQARELAVAELHRRMDMTQKSMHDFREHIGLHYVTHDSMKDVETRLTHSINATETRLTALLGKLEERLERSQHRGGGE